MRAHVRTGSSTRCSSATSARRRRHIEPGSLKWQPDRTGCFCKLDHRSREAQRWFRWTADAIELNDRRVE
jgi:hypothetical protein